MEKNMSLTRKQFNEFVAMYNPCSRARRWLKNNAKKNPQQLWNQCRNYSYLRWLIENSEVQIPPECQVELKLCNVLPYRKKSHKKALILKKYVRWEKVEKEILDYVRKNVRTTLTIELAVPRDMVGLRVESTVYNKLYNTYHVVSIK